MMSLTLQPTTAQAAQAARVTVREAILVRKRVQIQLVNRAMQVARVMVQTVVAVKEPPMAEMPVAALTMEANSGTE